MVLIVNCREALKTLWFLLSAKQSNRQFWSVFSSNFYLYIVSTWYTFEHWNHALFICILNVYTNKTFFFPYRFLFFLSPDPRHAISLLFFFGILPKVLAIFLHSYFYWDTFFKVRVTTLRGEQWLSFYHGPTEITPWYSIKWYKTFSSISCDVSEGVL